MCAKISSNQIPIFRNSSLLKEKKMIGLKKKEYIFPYDKSIYVWYNVSINTVVFYIYRVYLRVLENQQFREKAKCQEHFYEELQRTICTAPTPG